MLWFKIWELVTKLDQDSKRWNAWESEENKGEGVVVIDSETDEVPKAI